MTPLLGRQSRFWPVMPMGTVPSRLASRSSRARVRCVAMAVRSQLAPGRRTTLTITLARSWMRVRKLCTGRPSGAALACAWPTARPGPSRPVSTSGSAGSNSINGLSPVSQTAWRFGSRPPPGRPEAGALRVLAHATAGVTVRPVRADSVAASASSRAARPSVPSGDSAPPLSSAVMKVSSSA